MIARFLEGLAVSKCLMHEQSLAFDSWLQTTAVGIMVFIYLLYTTLFCLVVLHYFVNRWIATHTNDMIQNQQALYCNNLPHQAQTSQISHEANFQEREAEECYSMKVQLTEDAILFFNSLLFYFPSAMQ